MRNGRCINHLLLQNMSSNNHNSSNHKKETKLCKYQRKVITEFIMKFKACSFYANVMQSFSSIFGAFDIYNFIYNSI